MARTTKTGKDAHHRVVAQRATPMEALFEAWELADWASINRSVAAGKSVSIEHASANDEDKWIGCALRELGRQNVYVAFCHLRLDDVNSYGLWIMPRSSLKGVLLDGYEHVYG